MRIHPEDLELIESTKLHEGFRSHPYRCPAGKLTVGYGLNLEAGITRPEAEAIMRIRLADLVYALAEEYPWFSKLTSARQRVLVEMAYQMGREGLRGFRHTLAAIERGDYGRAADEMVESKWAKHDSPSRAWKLARKMRLG